MPPDSTPPFLDLVAVRAKIQSRLAYPKGAVDYSEPVPRYAKPPLGTDLNLEMILSQDPAFYPLLGHNVFTDEVTWNGVTLTDTLETGVNLQIQQVYGIHVSVERMRAILVFVAHRRPYHPVRDWIDAQRWDGVKRIDTLLTYYAGVKVIAGLSEAEDAALLAAMARKWMVSAVARIYDPGCKVDTMLILVGIQGAAKSSLFASLCERPDWFSDSGLTIGDKDAFLQLAGVWIYELGELSALQGREAEPVKAFITSRFDRYRPPYGRNIVRKARQGVLVGSTNAAEFLDDPTGARRFWPVRSTTINHDAIIQDRAQLWAEALVAYRNHETWWFDKVQAVSLTADQGQYQRADSWSDIIGPWLAGQMGAVTVHEVLSSALNLEPRDQTKGAAMRAGAVIASLGWVKVRDSEPPRVWRWARASKEAL